MRILVTNDDGVFAPGIAALARGLFASFSGIHKLIVVAPLTDHSGAGAAVGPVYERESIPFEEVDIPGLADVSIYGIDGPPALAVILACIEGFGPRPDLVVSGINHGINAGRSALHSGTVGATLTAAQFGIRGLAVSIAWGSDPVPWESPVALAAGIVPTMAATAPATVLNLNVPARPLHALRGLRHGSLGTVGLIRSIRPGALRPPGRRHADRQDIESDHPDAPGDGTPADHAAEQAELEPDSDAALIADGWATLTPLSGVREDTSTAANGALEAALATHLTSDGERARHLRNPAPRRESGQSVVQPIEGHLGREPDVVGLTVGRGAVTGGEQDRCHRPPDAGDERVELGPGLGTFTIPHQGQHRAADRGHQVPESIGEHALSPGVEGGDAEPVADGRDPPLHLVGHQVLGDTGDVFGSYVA